MSLGKGLSALISSTSSRQKIRMGALAGTADSGGKIWDIPISAIVKNPRQPRQSFDPHSLDELASSIKEHGILQPILVSEKPDGGYELISGERRWRAAQLAGLAVVPAIVKKMADQQKLEVSLIENIQREDLNPLEEAFAYKRLMDEFNLTTQEVANKVGKARPTVSNMIRLLGLPEEVKKALLDKKITVGSARALLGLKTVEEQLEMFASMVGEKISQSDLEHAVSRKTMDIKKPAKQRDPNIIYLEDQLRSVLDTKVLITERKGKGKVTVDYYSKEELSKLVDKLLA